MLGLIKSYFVDKEKTTRIVVVGGGTGGITSAAQLNNNFKEKAEITIVEPSTVHYYQPLFTLIGGGIFKKEKSVCNTEDVIPKGTKWLKDSVVTFVPTENKVVTKAGETIPYDYLVVSMGIQMNFDKIKGLKQNLGKNGVACNYHPDYVENTFEFLQNLKQNIQLHQKDPSELKKPLNLIFTCPVTPVKCAGAVQKVMYLADDYFRKSGQRDKVNMQYNTALLTMFAVKKYADALDTLAKGRGIQQNFQHNLVEIKGETKEAVFETPQGLKKVPYDFIHVVPPMGPPDAIRQSPFADPITGYMDVNKETLQSKSFPNVFGLGDCTNLPTSKTAAAISSQAPVLVSNLISHKLGLPLTATYKGYTACPITTSYNKMILAEFLYNNEVKESFPFDQGVESYTPMLIKKYIFPTAYWNLMLKGYWFGPNLLKNPYPPHSL
ncbi:putative sulfide quinone reductase [Tieghemostelium lacteum]|uniref:Sulfide:quinone oxidoreductase, mitochondrial n=1 Tax=Tieghemostelium lacteum TaxID=361077 RepID=A0A152A8V4_TIELA|nr:putative sulfide quinone reductase [Tieghemostelium lacteum]|eukprot:KYR02652.1 putative sulfide quinone reductase [Tieghemostelium lacteum]